MTVLRPVQCLAGISLEVRATSFVGHTNCGMVSLMHRRDPFISGLVRRGGCQQEWAGGHFMNSMAKFEIGNEVDFLVAEARRLSGRYPTLSVVPLISRGETIDSTR